MFTTICAYLLIGLFFVVEGRMRKGEDAKSFEAGQYDQNSTRLIGLGFGLSLIMLLVAPLLNHFQLGEIADGVIVGALGLVFMVVGLLLRYWANHTLGAYYSRTLLVQSDQHIIDYGPYRWIRNPGYLGTLLLFIGASFAVVNWVAVVVIAVMLFTAYTYRIRSEEAMLLTQFGDAYKAYMGRSWKLIPLIF